MHWAQFQREGSSSTGHGCSQISQAGSSLAALKYVHAGHVHSKTSCAILIFFEMAVLINSRLSHLSIIHSFSFTFTRSLASFVPTEIILSIL